MHEWLLYVEDRENVLCYMVCCCVWCLCVMVFIWCGCVCYASWCVLCEGELQECKEVIYCMCEHNLYVLCI